MLLFLPGFTLVLTHRAGKEAVFGEEVLAQVQIDINRG